MAIILVTGVPGVGKTSALANLQTRRPIVNFGTAILASAAHAYPDMTRDELRLLPKEERARLRDLAATTLPDNAIVDVHLSIRTAEGLEASVPGALTSRHIGAILVLEAPPSEVMGRRRTRDGRSDPADSEATIEEQQAFNRTAARTLAEHCSAKLVFIRGPKGVASFSAELSRAIAEHSEHG